MTLEKTKEELTAETVERLKVKLGLPVVKLSIGAGLHWKQPFDEWINHDGLPSEHVDVISEFGSIPLPDKCVDYLELGDVCEHLVKWRQDEIWHEWNRLVKIGGKIHLSTPNMHRAMVEYSLHTMFGKELPAGRVVVTAIDKNNQQYSAEFDLPSRPDSTPLIAAKQQIYAWQTTAYEQHYDCYTVETMTELLTKYGFTDIDFSESPGVDSNPYKAMSWWICCTAIKKTDY